MDKILYWLIGTLLIRISFREVQKLYSSPTPEKVNTKTKELITRGINNFKTLGEDYLEVLKVNSYD